MWQNDDFLGHAQQKSCAVFLCIFPFFGWCCMFFFVKLGLLSNLDIDIVTSTWPFWQMSSLLHHALFKKSHNFTNSWKTEGKTKPKFQCTLTPLYYCILHLHKKNFITTKCHHGKSDQKMVGKSSLWDVRREWFSNGEGPTISAHEGIALFTLPHGLATSISTLEASHSRLDHIPIYPKKTHWKCLTWILKLMVWNIFLSNMAVFGIIPNTRFMV